MYIECVRIENIRSLAEFIWELRPDDTKPGWHVLIGDNGSGKSSVLRAISLGLIGPKQALRLNPRWEEWLRYDTVAASIALEISYDREFDRYSSRQRPFQGHIEIELNLRRDREGEKLDNIEFTEFASNPKSNSLRQRANNSIWGENKGWFSAGYGPFRRFSGSDAQTQSIVFTPGKAAAHATVFFESVALSNYREWLQNLDYTSSRGAKAEASEAQQLLERIKAFINQDGFLPYDIRFDAIVPSATGTTVIFVDGDGNRVNIEQLGDGYRSILSMTLELMRQMTLQYDIDQIFDKTDLTHIQAPGVVLIDEIDVHLHPQWQRRIGFWLIEHFPNIQFIVTTHSPLVCQAASRGSIWRLSAPGSNMKSYRIDKENPKTQEEWKRLVYGDILEAYSTDLFGENIERSPEAQQKLQRVAELSMKEIDQPLSEGEKGELKKLMGELPSTPYKRTVSLNND